MVGRNLAFLIAFLFFSYNSHASNDLGQVVSGDPELQDTIGSSKASGKSPYVVEGEAADSVENIKTKGEDYIFNNNLKEVSGNISQKRKLQDFGYTSPGTYENQENYLETDKTKMANDFRKASAGGLNISFIKNDFDYQSNNDIINRTIGSGYKSVKGGALYFRNDAYFMKTDFLQLHWSLGAGVGYNSGRGIFVNGTRSDTTFKLWEVPIDLGVGVDIPFGSLFKISGTGGGSVTALMQNRSDFQAGEKGKRKYQVSPGYFASGQFKVNLSGFSDKMAYDIFTTSEITNLFLNLEIRHESYSKFQDPITISGTSYGIGFTFEYL